MQDHSAIMYRIKYRDVVKPNAKQIALDLIPQIEAQTGKKVKIKKLTLYSDEMRVEFKELPEDEKD